MTKYTDVRSHPDGAGPQDGLSRRAVLGRSAAGVGIALSGSFGGLFGAAPACPARAAGGGKPKGAVGYGPLLDDRAGLLSLPAGFSYRVIAESGVTRLESGEPT